MRLRPARAEKLAELLREVHARSVDHRDPALAAEARAQGGEQEQVLAGRYRQAVADVQDRLAPGNAGHPADDRVDRLEGAAHPVALRLGVGLDAGLGRRSPAAVGLDGADQILDGMVARGLAVGDVGGELLHGGQVGDDLLHVRGERHPDGEAAVVAHQHHLVAGGELPAQEVRQAGEDVVAVARAEVDVVDQDDEAEALVLGARGGSGSRSRRPGRARLGEEVGDLDGLAVLQDLEVLARQARYRLALLVGDEDLEVDDADLDGLVEGVRLPRGFLRRELRGRQQHGQGEGASPRLHKHSSSGSVAP